MIFWILNAWHWVRRENLTRLAAVLAVMLLLSSLGLAWVEPDCSFTDAVWLSLVTMTTVGYGDMVPTTTAGRVIGVLIMFTGIGVLGMFSATIAGILVERRLKGDWGMGSFHFEGHFIICEWNQRARLILSELRTDPRTRSKIVVLIADIDRKPVDDHDLHFVKGEVSEETLKRANLEQASTVIVLGDDSLDSVARDAQVVLSTLTIESLHPEAYTIVELTDSANSKHCERAHADEIVVPYEFGSRLISQAARDRGLTKVVSELLSSQRGADLYKLPVPEELAGRTFLEVFTQLKGSHNRTVVALQKNDGQVLSNPCGDQLVEEQDHLIVIE